MQVTNLNDKTLKTKALVLYYTVLFAVISAGVFCVFIIFGKSFIQYGDGFRQGYFWTSEIKHIVSSVLSGNGLPQWNWARGLGMQYLYRVDPFNLFASLFSIKYLELGITISLILKLYCGGLAYLFFAREMKMSNYQCIIGPVCYIFSTWFINVTMIQSSFIFIAFMMPLLILGIDWIYRGKSPVLFILVVAYFLIRDTYLAYMAAIVAILFMLFRYFAHTQAFNIKEYFSWIGKFVIYGLTAGLLSATFCLQFILATMRASTESSHSNSLDLFCDPSFLFGFGRTLSTAGLTTGYTYIGIPMLAILVLPIALKRISLKNTGALITAVLLIMTLFPIFSRMFNGFSYGTGRWFVMIVFFASWATMECFDIEDLRNKGNLKIMIIWLAIFAVWTIGFDAVGLIGLSLRAKAFIILNILTGAVLIFVIAALKTEKITIKHRQIATVVVTVSMLIVGWSMSFYLYQDKFINIGEVGKNLDTATQRVSAMIEDGGFYRVDQVDWLNQHRQMEMPDTEALWFQSRSIYAYDSFTSSKQLKFNKYLGNNYGYLMRVYYLSNNNRMGLDFLQGVKYFLGDDSKGGQIGSDAYAGYGFTLKEKLDGVNIFENKYDVGLGFAYDNYISEKEFLKLTRLEREQALLQAAVLPNKTCKTLENSLELKAKDIDTDVTELPYEIISMDGITMENGKIVTTKENASFVVKLNDISNSQVIASFDNLIRLDNHSFSIHCNDNKHDIVVHTGHTNQCLPDICDFDMNMGYYNSFNGEMTVTINHAGEYTYDRFYMSAMNVDNYNKYAQQRINEKFEIDEFDNKHVTGTVNVKSNGIMYFSIPQYTNWEVYVDGNKVEKLTNVNIAYMGAEIPEGHHEVVLKYNNTSLKFGIAASILGLLLTIVYGLHFRRKRKVLE